MDEVCVKGAGLVGGGRGGIYTSDSIGYGELS